MSDVSPLKKPDWVDKMQEERTKRSRESNHERLGLVLNELIQRGILVHDLEDLLTMNDDTPEDFQDYLLDHAHTIAVRGTVMVTLEELAQMLEVESEVTKEESEE